MSRPKTRAQAPMLSLYPGYDQKLDDIAAAIAQARGKRTPNRSVALAALIDQFDLEAYLASQQPDEPAPRLRARAAMLSLYFGYVEKLDKIAKAIAQARGKKTPNRSGALRAMLDQFDLEAYLATLQQRETDPQPV